MIDALDNITVSTRVASSSGHQSLRFKRHLTGLYSRFAGNIFSAEDVTHAKPAPDVFLFAAQAMGAPPHRGAP